MTMSDAEMDAREAYEPGSVWDRPDVDYADLALQALAGVEDGLRYALPRTVGEEEGADPGELIDAIDVAIAECGEVEEMLRDCAKALEHYDEILWAVRSLAGAVALCDDSILPAAVRDLLDKVKRY